ncbi:MAG: hypothetical protein ACPKQO_02120 [Nitrososphaeraceae archaeon]
MFKIGILSVLLFATVLLIPAISLTYAQQYEDRYGKISDIYYDDDRYYYEEDNEYVYEEYYYPSKDKKKEPPMLLVKKDVLYCDGLANGTGPECINPIPGPDSERYVKECVDDNPVCNNINKEAFNIIVTDDIEFPGSEEGTKLNFNGQRFTVTEEQFISDENINSQCLEAGFDGGFAFPFGTGGSAIFICILNEGECSGIIQDGELEECTVKNYAVGVGV